MNVGVRTAKAPASRFGGHGAASRARAASSPGSSVSASGLTGGAVFDRLRELEDENRRLQAERDAYKAELDIRDRMP